MFSPTSVSAGLAVIFLAAFIQGVTGFGFALIAVPLLSIFIFPLQRVVPMVVFYSLLTNIMLLVHGKAHIDLKRIWPLILFGVAGIFPGTYMLAVVHPSLLKILIGIVIIVTAVAMLKGYKVTIRNEKASFMLVGLLSGILNGSTALSGPPVVLFLANQQVEKDTFKANLSAYALITNIITLAALWAGGTLNAGTAGFTAILLPALALGVLIGLKTAASIRERLFRKLTLALIIVSALSTLVTSLHG